MKNDFNVIILFVGARDTQFFNLNFGLAPTWQDCVRVARNKMEKYFVHKVIKFSIWLIMDFIMEIKKARLYGS